MRIFSFHFCALTGSMALHQENAHLYSPPSSAGQRDAVISPKFQLSARSLSPLALENHAYHTCSHSQILATTHHLPGLTSNLTDALGSSLTGFLSVPFPHPQPPRTGIVFMPRGSNSALCPPGRPGPVPSHPLAQPDEPTALPSTILCSRRCPQPPRQLSLHTAPRGFPESRR